MKGRRDTDRATGGSLFNLEQKKHDEKRAKSHYCEQRTLLAECRTIKLEVEKVMKVNVSLEMILL